MPQTQSRYLTTVIVGGRDIGAFATYSGGGVAAEVVLDRAPGAEFPTASGADKTIAEITVTRPVEILRDTAELEAYLDRYVGMTDAVTVGRKPYDADGNPYGPGRTRIGTLTAVNPTDSDVNSQGERTSLELVIQPSR